MEKISFEDSIKRIEEIVALLERGSVSLDKSLELFEEGNRLIRNCTHELDNAEQKLKILVSDGENVTEEPFEIEEQ